MKKLGELKKSLTLETKKLGFFLCFLFAQCVNFIDISVDDVFRLGSSLPLRLGSSLLLGQICACHSLEMLFICLRAILCLLYRI